MKNKIIVDLDNPEKLEMMYQFHKEQFEAWLVEAIEKFPDSETLKVWNARVHYTPITSERIDKQGVSFIVILSLLSFAILKIPSILSISGNWFYTRFSTITVIGSLIIYFLVTRIHSHAQNVLIVCCLLFSILFMIVLPNQPASDSVTMSCIHVPLFLLSILAISFMASDWKDIENRLIFIRYLGEIIIYGSIILLGGVVLTTVTIGLFRLIELSIESWYFEYIVVLGLAATPIVATYLYDKILYQRSNLANIIANIFSPLFLATVVCYLFAMLYKQKSPYTDRDFLIIFNGLLILVWGITVFSIAGKDNEQESKMTSTINMSLIIATLLIDGIALSAISFRLLEYGMSPNKIVVIGSNVLTFFHLSFIFVAYFRYIKSNNVLTLKISIANFLPIYVVWSLFVVIVLPFIFTFQ